MIPPLRPNAATPRLPPRDVLRLVIFDCDGVLFDSWKANVAFYDAVLAAVGLPPLDDEGRRLCHTLSSPQLYARLFPADSLMQRRIAEVARATDYGPFYALMEPVEGLEPTLRRLTAHCPLALATNRGTTVRGVVEHFGLAPFFAIRLGILDVARPKPAPDLLVACLEHAGVEASAAVYVGDTELDRDAAAGAGVAYVGVGPASGADVRVNGIRELPALLLR
ncbi:MAG: HAD family hydrolase [Deltaproteobacteria bacterium]|nr:HAD family hydrolase [Deltaproteobacteria bacterium]